MKLFKVRAWIDADGYRMTVTPYEAVERAKTFTVFKPDSSFSNVKTLIVKKSKIGEIDTKMTPPIVFAKLTWCHENQLEATKEYLRLALLNQVEEYISNMSVKLEILAKIIKRQKKNDTSRTERPHSELDKQPSVD